MYVSSLIYPTLLHQQAAETAYRFFQPLAGVDTVLVLNSCARGQAVPESDLDMAVLVSPEMPAEEITRLEASWRQEMISNAVLRRYRESGSHAHVHLDLIRGEYIPEVRDDGGGPDSFELGIGNHLAYSVPLQAAGPYFLQLQGQYLPYYNPDLRRQRLETARAAVIYDLDHVPFFIGRELYFQAFDRLYKGFQEFLQALFISRRVYPLAYNKWIRLQVEGWLGLPKLYCALPAVLSVRNIEGSEILNNARILTDLLESYVGGDY